MNNSSSFILPLTILKVGYLILNKEELNMIRLTKTYPDISRTWVKINYMSSSDKTDRANRLYFKLFTEENKLNYFEKTSQKIGW